MGCKLTLEAIATLVGTVIGAGIFGIPYVVSRAGFVTGIIDIVALGLVAMILYLHLGEVVLRTQGIHQLTGYASKYLGRWGRILMLFSMVFGIFGALIAYLIGEGQAFSAILGGQPVFWSLAFFAVTAVIIYAGLKAVARAELGMLPAVMGIVILVAIFTFKYINPANYTTFDISRMLLPYGVVLFAFLGASAIPEMREELIKNEKSLKKAIIIGMLIPMAVYLIFAFLVVGVTGGATTEVASIGLGRIIGERMVILGNIFAIFTMGTSFLTLGLALRMMLNYDFKINPKIAWALTIFAPLAIMLSGATSFIKAIGISGVVAGGMEGALIILMNWKAKKHGNRKPEYSIRFNWIFAGLLIALFVAGAVTYFLF